MGFKPLLAAPNGAPFGLAVPISNVAIEDPAGTAATEAGYQVRDRILSALRREDPESRVRALAACVRDFPKETLRCPEVHEFLEWLVTHRKSRAVDRILRDGPLRGRAQRTTAEVYFEVAIIDAIRRRESCSVERAAQLARDEHEELRHKSVLSLENDYGRGRDAYRLLNAVRFLPGSAVTDRPWTRPQREPNRSERR
jgi:hypothetical protein